MPELTVVHIGLLALVLVVGTVIGWVIRADRCAKEKIAVNASWQDQLESQQSEHNRLAEQNKSLMEQISQYQASQKDYSNRAKELSDSLKEAFARRDELQRQLKDTRAKLELAVMQRNKAREALPQNPAGQAAALKEKDDKIFHLSRELTSWQSRVPPLVERFQEKNQQVIELSKDLEMTRARLEALEELVKSDQTRIEPVNAESLPDGGDASNEPIAMTAAHDASEIQDQIDEDVTDNDLEREFGNPDVQADVVAMRDFSAPAADDDIEETFDDVFAEDGDGEDSFHAAASADDGIAVGTAFAEDDWSSTDDNTADEEEENEKCSESGDAAQGNGPDTSEQDDLQQIKGIGPSIAKTLNELGVYRFHQIAEMSEYEIDRVAQQLRGFRSRIYREDWIGQARDLQYQKNNRRS